MLLRNAWATGGLALIAGGLIASAGPVVALGLLVLLAGGAARIWADRSLRGVELERLLPESRAFPGEQLRLTYRLTNRALLPLPSLEMRHLLPEELAPQALGLPSAGPGAKTYRKSTQLRWRQRKTWSIDLACSKRGYYRLGPVRLRSGDGFGLFTREGEVRDQAAIVVYPRTVSLPELGLPAARPLGEYKGRERIFEDPLRIAGLRDYQPGDPMRRIDWKATARRGALQSRVYEPSTTQHLFVALNVDTLSRPSQGYDATLLESNIIVAASVARWAFEARFAVGLLANGALPESKQPISLAPGRSPDQLSRILEALGSIGPLTLVSLAALIEEQSHRLPLGATLVVVTAIMPEALAAVLRRLAASGQRVVVMTTVDDHWPELPGGAAVRRISRPDLTASEALTKAALS